MPWKPELYPKNWKELSHACKERAHWQCEQCGVAEGAVRLNRQGQAYTVRLTAAHLDHDPENPNARLAAFCEVCHLRYDSQIHATHAHGTRCKKRHQAKINAGQLEMFKLPHYTYQFQYRRCGKPHCTICRDGKGHGPYWYGYWRDETTGRLRSRYIGKEAPLQRNEAKS